MEHDTRSERNRILVSGLLNVETTVAVRGFPISYYPIDYPFFGVTSRVSGVGYNVARALATLGDEVRLLSFLGRDPEGERVLARLREDGSSMLTDSRSASCPRRRVSRGSAPGIALAWI